MHPENQMQYEIQGLIRVTSVSPGSSEISVDVIYKERKERYRLNVFLKKKLAISQQVFYNY